MRTLLKILTLTLTVGSLSSCVSHTELINYKQDTLSERTVTIENPPEIRIQTDDVLDIKVHSQDLETAAPFNLNPGDMGARGGGDIEGLSLNGYLVDQNGMIDFPILGKLEIKGLSMAEAKDKIVEDLKYFLKNPVVNIRLVNFRVTVSGEVYSPGSFVIYDERVTVPEAITLAGDLTNYADRANILIVREINGQRSFNRVNMLSANIFQSEFYYLKQNDLIYVEPLKEKTGAIRDQSNETLSFISAGATLVAVIVALFR